MNADFARLSLALALTAAFAAPTSHAAQNTLAGWAVLPANTFSDGPTSGQFAGAGAGGNPLPLVDLQPVQGFSGVLAGANGSFRVISDNGFGAQGNSGDTLLRSYAVNVDFRTAQGGSGSVSAADWNSGASLPAFNAASRITLSDPKNLLSIKIQADYTNYYNN
ncbi:MAG: PEP-CTERM sorting domain-containing protein, partial [Methyloversatilis sp. 12-65-5]